MERLSGQATPDMLEAAAGETFSLRNVFLLLCQNAKAVSPSSSSLPRAFCLLSRDIYLPTLIVEKECSPVNGKSIITGLNSTTK